MCTQFECGYNDLMMEQQKGTDLIIAPIKLYNAYFSVKAVIGLK